MSRTRQKWTWEAWPGGAWRARWKDPNGGEVIAFVYGQEHIEAPKIAMHITSGVLINPEMFAALTQGANNRWWGRHPETNLTLTEGSDWT